MKNLSRSIALSCLLLCVGATGAQAKHAVQPKADIPAPSVSAPVTKTVESPNTEVDPFLAAAQSATKQSAGSSEVPWYEADLKLPKVKSNTKASKKKQRRAKAPANMGSAITLTAAIQTKRKATVPSGFCGKRCNKSARTLNLHKLTKK